MSQRLARIHPFHVMALLARARALEAAGRDVVHLEIGEPDLPTPEPVVAAGIRALEQGATHYTPALGLPALREAIADHYRRRYGVAVAPSRVAVTPGASGALLLALGCLVESGSRVLVPDPGYPCNRHFVAFLGGVADPLPVGPESRYQPTPEAVAAAWRPETRALVVGSPANPTGTVLDREALAALAATVEARGGRLIADEIYHGLVYGGEAATALAASPGCFVVNSFSKHFHMPGWRLGWLVVPEGYEGAVDRLAQNLFLAAPTPAQHAALACFTPEVEAILADYRETYRRRRDALIPRLARLGLHLPVAPEGAFYLYADCSAVTDDSFAFAEHCLEEAAVALTPGIDFGDHQAERHLRIAFTAELPRLEEGVERIRRLLGG
ncbi:MAG: pyridoxal phosphate-dependent aminotransferase [Nitrospirae bacterium]|nr:MAG: pyridoxal phosphate-dependent aminotransferase [Nitrospirota bacterium]